MPGHRLEYFAGWPRASGRQRQCPARTPTFLFPVESPVTNTPINDDPDFEPPEKFQPIVILLFLNFHRRFIFGLFLLAGVAYMLLRLNEQGPVEEANASDAFQASASLPQPTLTDASSRAEETVTPVATEPEKRTVSQRINWLLNSVSNWQDKSTPDAIIVLQIRIGQIRELMENPDLKPRQRAYCTQEYVKAVGFLSEQNQNSTTGVEGIDEMIAEVQQAYEESEDTEIAAVAKAVWVGHLARKFAENQNEDNFQAFETAFLERRDAIANSDQARRHISKAICDTSAQATEHPRLREIATDHLSTVIYMDDTSVVDLAKNLFFPEVDWKTLPTRLKSQSPGAEADIQILLERLKKYPETPLIIYSTVASTIKWYQDAEESEKANKYLVQLEEIAPTITSKLIHDEVAKGIRMLKDGTTQ